MASLLSRYNHACSCNARRGFCPARLLPKRPKGVLTNGPANSQSFVKRHQEVLEDSEWYGPEAPEHTVSPALVAVAAATTANRGDVRLISCFTTYLRSHKIHLSAVFCADPVLSADSRVVCDLQAGHHAELLSEYLTSGGMRVGEELPHWFVNGNVRGAIKAWMATRPAAASLIAGGAGEAHSSTDAVRTLAVSVAAADPHLGAAADRLVDPLLAAMPAWQPSSVRELAGWEPGPCATEQDVSLLHCFGTLVYSCRLDVTAFLQQLCGADPFSWVTVQVAQGSVSEPDPWLLERFFMSRHTVGEALPMWFATWGVREKLRQWLTGPQASALVNSTLTARGIIVPTNTTTGGADANGSGADGATSGGSPGATLDLLEAAAARLLPAGVAVHYQRDAVLTDESDLSGSCYRADLLARREDGAGGVVAVALRFESGDVAALRQAKERLDWLGLLAQHTNGWPNPAVAKVLLLLPVGEGQISSSSGNGCDAGARSLPASVKEYLEQSGVWCVWASELAVVLQTA